MGVISKEITKAAVDGYLNLQIELEDGTLIPFSCYIPLDAQKDMQNGLLEATKADANMTFKFVGSVKVIDKDAAPRKFVFAKAS
jgi:hypothetical protein